MNQEARRVVDEPQPIAPVAAIGQAGRPVRKDEIVIDERGLYVESWLPERRSRRKPLYLLHGELGGSWLWERYLGYFARRGWEGHALNLRGHFWSETGELAELTFDSYLEDAIAGAERLNRPPVVIGHGMGGLLALKLAEVHEVAGLVLIAPALPVELRDPGPPEPARATPPIYRQDVIGWQGPLDHVRRQNPDLSVEDVMRIHHFLSAESAAARRAVLEGVPVDRERLRELSMLVIGGGLDRQFREADSERLADWLGAHYEPFGAHSHYGLVLGEATYEQVADAIRGFLEAHKL